MEFNPKKIQLSHCKCHDNHELNDVNDKKELNYSGFLLTVRACEMAERSINATEIILIVQPGSFHGKLNAYKKPCTDNTTQERSNAMSKKIVAEIPLRAAREFFLRKLIKSIKTYNRNEKVL
jgi:hypothetical protein